MAASDTPTRKQHAELRRLANRTGQTFTMPRTRGEASAEIRRLRGQGRSSRIERALERRDVSAAARGDQAAVRADEIVGYGGHAHWRGSES